MLLMIILRNDTIYIQIS